MSKRVYLTDPHELYRRMLGGWQLIRRGGTSGNWRLEKPGNDDIFVKWNAIDALVRGGKIASQGADEYVVVEG